MIDLYIIDPEAKFPCVNCGKEFTAPKLSDGMPATDIFCDNICGEAYYTNQTRKQVEQKYLLDF